MSRSSSRSSPSRLERAPQAGISLVEVLVALGLVAVSFLAIVELLGQSRRVTAMASRHVQASTEAQTLLEGICALDPAELPPDAHGAAWTEILGDGAPDATGGAQHWSDIAAFFKKRCREALERHVEFQQGDDPDHVLVRVRVLWKIPTAGAQPQRELVLLGLVVKKV